MEQSMKGLALCLALAMPFAGAARAQDNAAADNSQQNAAEESQGDPGELDVIHLPDGLDLPDAPGFDFLLSGLVQGDGLAYHDIGGGFFGDEDVNAQVKDTELRRARLAAVIRYNLDWRAKVSADFANKPYLRDLSIEYRKGAYSLEAGRIVEPFGVLAGGSSTMALMERPLAEGLAPGYGLGVAGNANGDRWGVTLGVFESTQNNVQDGGRQERAITFRPTFALLRKETQTIHFGIAASYRETKDGPLQFVAIPESVLMYGLNIHSSPVFTDREAGEKNKYELYGIELGMLFGPVMILTEGTFAHIPDAFTFNSGTATESSDALYTGYYFEADWSLTGERRDYSVRKGAFSGLEPNSSFLNGGTGAFEIGARFGAIELQDEFLSGESGVTASVGLNWYPEEHTRAVIEYLHVEKVGFDDPDQDRSADAVQLRLQATFTGP